MSNDAIKQKLLGALYRAFQPLARIALKGGLGFKDIEETMKLAMVRVARDDHGLAGRKTNISRVAILTGLSRKECTRLRERADAGDLETATALGPAARLLAGWHSDAEFCADNGEPKALPESGPVSLEALVKRYAGDTPARALIKELERVGVLETDGDGNTLPTRRSFIATGFDADKVRIMGNQLSDLGQTIFFNLDSESEGARRLQRYVANDSLPEGEVGAFQELATQRAQQLLEDLDDYLTERVERDGDAGTDKQTRRVGLGVYFFTD